MTSPEPSLVFLHGAPGPKSRSRWLTPLLTSLKKHHAIGWDPRIIEIDYLPLIKKGRGGVASASFSTDSRAFEPSREATERFTRSRQELKLRLQPHKRRRRPWGRHASEGLRKRVANVGRKRMFKGNARRYRTRRNEVIHHVLEEMGPGDAIVIGYSLGSAVAADLLPRLRPDQHIRLLVTLGSPLMANRWERTFKSLKPFPYDNVDAWVNIRSISDPITGWRSLRRRLHQVIDVRIGGFDTRTDLVERVRHGRRITRKQVMNLHHIRHYSRHQAVAEAVAWALESDRPSSPS